MADCRRTFSFSRPKLVRAALHAAFLLVLPLATLPGCGGGSGSANTAHLKGKVTLAGQAIPDNARASITFKPTRGGQGKTTFAKIAGGEYDSPDTPKGPVKVFVSIQQPTGKMVSEAGGTPYEEMRSLVPPKYTAGIDLEVSDDNLEQDFDLK